MKLSHSLAAIALLVAGISNLTFADGYRNAIAADQKVSKSGSEKWTAAPHPYSDLIKAPVTLIPYPQKAQWSHERVLELPGTVSLVLGNAQLTTAKNSLAEALKNKGVKLSTTKAPDGKTLCRISLDPQKVAQQEGYRLLINEKGIHITAHDPAGAFYAVQTIKQMLRQNGDHATLPVCRIHDYPAFSLRGFMHDTGRNFQSVESLKTQIDRFAAYKLNAFHWHLTDNPAWRVESKAFPQLNDPKNRRAGRDEHSTYSFDQIREVIAYAKERHLMIIPELDMPGHSEYFAETFGFKMETPKGMAVLEKLIDEFCAEIPASDCPYLHLGADEVHIPNPNKFIQRMSAKVRSHKRTPILWNPGLPPTDERTVRQLWRDTNLSSKVDKSKNPIIDSGAGYVNGVEPQNIVRRYFFWQACHSPAGNAKALGGILCHWPDVNVNDKENIFRHSAVWPALLAFSESIWQGRGQPSARHMAKTPERGTDAWFYFREFEARLADHRKRFFAHVPFPYVKQTLTQWSVSNPYPIKAGKTDYSSLKPEKNPEDNTIEWHPITGSMVNLPRGKQAIPSTRYLRTYLHADSDREAHLMIGFDVPTRSTRRFPGIPRQGQWDASGGTIFLNGKEIPAPAWKEPGKYQYRHDTWGKPPNEIPYTDEQFFWTVQPTKVQLKKGANIILMRVPLVHKSQHYQAACIPVKQQGEHWIEDETITSSRK